MTRLCLLFVGLVVLLGGLGSAGPSAAASFDPEHPLFQAVLKQHMQDARVDYAGLKARPETLDRYLAGLGRVSRAEFKEWREADQIAFLCTAEVSQRSLDGFRIRYTDYDWSLNDWKR